MTKEFYEYFLNRGDDDAWGESDKFSNFALLTKITEYTNHSFIGSSILDVGCGTGDLAGFLKEKEIGMYTGIDIVKSVIEKAQQKYPEYTFITDDFLQHEFEEKFDFVLASGALALTLDTNNYEIFDAWLHKMWSLSNFGIAFNFLTSKNPEETQDELFLYDFEKVIKICKRVAPDARLSSSLNKAGSRHEFLQSHIYLAK